MKDNQLSHSQEKNLQEWLSYIENIHNVEIDLGLSRIKTVAERIALDFSFAQVITVAGTNGKGTTCAFIEEALISEGKTVSVYSSPHITDFNERLRINRIDIDEQSLVSAFEKIEHHRAEISLSYYEFTTLAAFIILQSIKPDYIILEVGLGGRLDATNLIDANIAVITTIDLDHQAFLGDTRELIGYEKAGIMRKDKFAVIGDLDPPRSILAHGEKINADLHVRSAAFMVTTNGNCWQWSNNKYHFQSLITPHIPLDNVATALQVLSLLSIPLDNDNINRWIESTKVAGRTELFTRPCHTLLDVGHNPQAARYLLKNLEQRGYDKIHAVVGMLTDKDIQGTLKPLTALISTWSLADLTVYRGAKAQELKKQLDADVPNESMQCFNSATQAFQHACDNAKANELVLVFGSFYTVAEIRPLLITESRHIALQSD